MKYQLIRHATAKLTYGGSTFLLDPAFARKGTGPSYAGRQNSPLTDMPCMMWEAESGADCIVLSHIHSDHFDEAAAKALDKDLPVLIQEEDAGNALLMDFEDVRPAAGGIFNEVAYERVTGRHGTSAPVLSDMGPSSGVVFMAAGEPTLYWAGDTVWCEEVRRAIEIYQPGVIVVHAGCALWNGEAIVMSAADVIEVCKAAPSARVIAVHMECSDHSTQTREDLRLAARQAGIADDRLLIPSDGETIEILQDTAF